MPRQVAPRDWGFKSTEKSRLKLRIPFTSTPPFSLCANNVLWKAEILILFLKTVSMYAPSNKSINRQKQARFPKFGTYFMLLYQQTCKNFSSGGSIVIRVRIQHCNVDLRVHPPRVCLEASIDMLYSRCFDRSTTKTCFADRNRPRRRKDVICRKLHMPNKKET